MIRSESDEKSKRHPSSTVRRVSKVKLLFILGSGGHTAQMLKLRNLLGNDYEYEYVINKDDKITEEKISGRFYKMTRARSYGDSRMKQIFNMGTNMLEALRIIKKSRAQVVVSTGPGLTIFIFLFARLLQKRTIFLESWSRVTIPSLSGKLCYLLSDMFFVQWPDLKKNYPKAIYRGRLL